MIIGLKTKISLRELRPKGFFYVLMARKISDLRTFTYHELEDENGNVMFIPAGQWGDRLDKDEIKIHIDRLTTHLRRFGKKIMDDIDEAYIQYEEEEEAKQKERRAIDAEIRNRTVVKGSIRTMVLKLHGNACLCCGSTEKIQIDHILPISKGGENNIENLQPLCWKCNRAKFNKTIDYRTPKCQTS